MKSERGFSLVEVVIAIALLGIVGVAFLGGLSTASKAIFTADERATAESLARTEMEYVRNQDYSIAPWDYELPSGTSSGVFPSWWNTANHTLPAGYAGYTVNVSTTLLPSHSTDDGIQKIAVDIKHLNKEIFTLEGYRSLR
jgi:prepilin-type N-terminal cleavage/methylation domain-containing protein